MIALQDWWTAYRLRWRRRRYLYRSFRKRRQLNTVADRTRTIAPDGILAFVTLRNEAQRLPHFLDHYRRLGVQHFLIVDNGSTDGSGELLSAQPDVSLWRTEASYRLSRFGLDWLTWLMMKYGHGHWCLTLDVDEILIYPHWESRPLKALTEWLDRSGLPVLPAMMLDMYPQGMIDQAAYVPGDDPFATLNWFDAGNYMIQRQQPLGNLWIQGGARARKFFAADPRRAPTLNKTPLVRWRRRYAYVNSTHALLPVRLNRSHGTGDAEMPSGILLHSKFLPGIAARSAEEMERAEHFNNSALYADYYDALTAAPDLWCAGSTRYRGWRHLEALGLMSRGGWL